MIVYDDLLIDIQIEMNIDYADLDSIMFQAVNRQENLRLRVGKTQGLWIVECLNVLNGFYSIASEFLVLIWPGNAPRKIIFIHREMPQRIMQAEDVLDQGLRHRIKPSQDSLGFISAFYFGL